MLLVIIILLSIIAVTLVFVFIVLFFIYLNTNNIMTLVELLERLNVATNVTAEKVSVVAQSQEDIAADLSVVAESAQNIAADIKRILDGQTDPALIQALGLVVDKAEGIAGAVTAVADKANDNAVKLDTQATYLNELAASNADPVPDPPVDPELPTDGEG